MKGLSTRQKEIFDFIVNYIDTYQVAPSYRNIQDHFRFASSGTVYKQITTLKRKGYLISEKGKSRSLALAPDPKNSTAEILLIGAIKKPLKIATFLSPKPLAVPASYLKDKEKSYALKVEGDVLREELIAPNDLLIVEARAKAFLGEVIFAYFNQELIIKRIEEKAGKIALFSLYSNDEPLLILPEQLSVQGAVIAVLRTFDTQLS